MNDYKYMTHSARNLRQRQTNAEKKLWYFLQNENLDGMKFRRQQPIGDYIVDFVCFEKKLIVELDGSQHNDARIKMADNRRPSWLESEGFLVIRFWYNEVLENTVGVLTRIQEMAKCLHPHPDLSHQGRRKKSAES